MQLYQLNLIKIKFNYAAAKDFWSCGTRGFINLNQIGGTNANKMEEG